QRISLFAKVPIGWVLGLSVHPKKGADSTVKHKFQARELPWNPTLDKERQERGTRQNHFRSPSVPLESSASRFPTTPLLGFPDPPLQDLRIPLLQVFRPVY